MRLHFLAFPVFGLVLLIAATAEAQSDYFEDWIDFSDGDDFPNNVFTTWGNTSGDITPYATKTGGSLTGNPFAKDPSTLFVDNELQGTHYVEMDFDTPVPFGYVSFWMGMSGASTAAHTVQWSFYDAGLEAIKLEMKYVNSVDEIVQVSNGVGTTQVGTNCAGGHNVFVVFELDFTGKTFDIYVYGEDLSLCGDELGLDFKSAATINEIETIRFTVVETLVTPVVDGWFDDFVFRETSWESPEAIPGFYLTVDNVSGGESTFTIDFPISLDDPSTPEPGWNYHVEYDAGSGYTFLPVYPGPEDLNDDDARVDFQIALTETGSVNWRVGVHARNIAGLQYSCVITANMGAEGNSYECGDPIGGGGPGSPAAPAGISGIVVSPSSGPAEAIINFRWPLSTSDPDQDTGLFQYELLLDGSSMCVDTLTAEDGDGFRTAQCSPGNILGSHSFTVRATNTTSMLTSAVSCNILLTTDTLGSAATCGGVAYPGGVSAGGGSEPITLPGLDPEVLGTDLGISTAAAGWFLGLLLIGGLAGGLATIPGFGLGGGILGFILGTGVSVAFGLIPFWFPFLLVIVGGAALVMFMGSGGG